MDEALTITRSAFRDSATISKEIASIAPFLLPEKEQRANILAWHAFWRAKKGQDLRDGDPEECGPLWIFNRCLHPFSRSDAP